MSNCPIHCALPKYTGLKIIKNLGPWIIERTKEANNFSVPYSEDESTYNALKKKLQCEEQRRLGALFLVEETQIQLEACKKDLDEAEKERAAVIVYRTAAETKAETLKKQLLEKEEKATDTPSAPNKEVGQQVDDDIPSSDDAEIPLQVPSRNSSPPNQEANRQVNSDISGAGDTKISLPSCTSPALNQEVDKQVNSGMSGAGRAEFLLPSHTPSMSIQEVGQQVNGNVPNADGTKYPLASRSFLRPDISGKCLHHKLIYILSVVIGFVAIAIQYALDSEKQRGNTGLMWPGWAHHQNKGLQYLHVDSL
ncbi:hypothetical protein H4582DRAFT_2074604 [Lactarius indigo]|nr:hypothetical protein H4582DRAFT_2074604 [Lactarius indigo]